MVLHWIDLPYIPDARGVLTSIESGLDVPFEIRRVFFMRDVRGERGGHAHRVTHQLLVPVAGSFRVEVSDGTESGSHTMNDPHRGLLLPPMTWVRLTDFTPDAVCLVLADTLYADVSYIRDWDEFVAMSTSSRATR
jgi:WxcM-like protein